MISVVGPATQPDPAMSFRVPAGLNHCRLDAVAHETIREHPSLAE
jgi:hypothetical protein